MPRGRPKGSQNKAAAKSRTSPTKINKDAAPTKISKDEDGPVSFTCTCCGKVYTKQKSNFPRTLSPLFSSNDNYFPVCRRCLDKYYAQLIEYYSGNEEKAMDRICQITDWYYRDDIFALTNKTDSDTTRVALYPSKMQLHQYQEKGTTYLDTVRDRASVVVSDYNEFEDEYERGETEITKAQIKRWGLGFEASEYKALDEHYKSLSESIDTNDVVQDTLAKDLCEIKIQQVRARNKGDAEGFQKFTKLYQETLKTANLKVKSGDTSTLTDSEVCWGNFIRDVEQYTPAEIYKDRQLFKDADGFRSYMERFVSRPVRNFFLGTRDMDPEFSIGVSDGEDD